MHMRNRTLAAVLLLSLSSAAEGGMREFVESHCVACHDSGGREAGLDLETAKVSLSSKANGFLWESVFDRVDRGEMPPQTADQPTSEERAVFLAALGHELRTASLARQAKEGRGPVRRLTRTEYEASVNDLLHLRTDLRSLFPDDAVTAGFDRVGVGLTLSAAHFAAYQEAAEKALNVAITRSSVLEWEQNGAELFQSKVKDFTNWGSWLEGDTMVVASRLNYPGTAVLGPRTPRSGRYRVTATAQARNNDGRLMPVAIGILDPLTVKANAPETSLWFDVPEEQPRTVSVELDLEPGQRIHLFGPSLEDGTKVLNLMKKDERWTGRVLVLIHLKIEGPLADDGTIDHWPGAGYHELFGDLAAQPLSKITGVAAEKGQPDPFFPVSAAPKDDAARLLRRFLSKAFRRDVPEDIAGSYVAEVHVALDRGVLFHRAMLDGYKSILCSPHFLLLEETPGLLDGSALASRLSYFLWNSTPDEQLLSAAANGELATSEGRAKQVERMLADARVERFERSFVDQWLDLKNLDATTPDGAMYAEITPSMIVAAEFETRRFFHELLAENRSVLESISSDWTYANELLSQLYDLPDISGYEMRKVALAPESRRGGFLTQASILKVTADGSKTSPIIRGKWVNERILGITPPNPPEDVAKIEPDIRGAATIREQLAKHRDNPACASCHAIIDPPGFALETFDVIGSWRDYYRMPKPTGSFVTLTRFGGRRVHRGPAVESGYAMPDGRAFADIAAYKAMLLEDEDRIASAFVEKLLVYATGARLQFADRNDVAAIVVQTREQHFGLRSLIHSVIQSRPFLHK
jgi:hypothetical protein